MRAWAASKRTVWRVGCGLGAVEGGRMALRRLSEAKAMKGSGINDSRRAAANVSAVSVSVGLGYGPIGRAERGVEESVFIATMDFVIELGVPACLGFELEVAGFEVDDGLRRHLLAAGGGQSTLRDG